MARSGKEYKDQSPTARSARRAASAPAPAMRIVAVFNDGATKRKPRHWYLERRGGAVYDENDDVVSSSARLAKVDEKATAPPPERDWPRFLGMAKSKLKLREIAEAKAIDEDWKSDGRRGEWVKVKRHRNPETMKGNAAAPSRGDGREPRP